jgi:hypothetical protein
MAECVRVRLDARPLGRSLHGTVDPDRIAHPAVGAAEERLTGSRRGSRRRTSAAPSEPTAGRNDAASRRRLQVADFGASSQLSASNDAEDG